MFCPTCQTVLWEAIEACPTCGGDVRAVTGTDAVEVVEAIAEVSASESGLEASTPQELTALTVAEPAMLPLPVRLVELSVAAWRQPGVRAAVKTGASALALSLAMRAARRAFTRVPSRRILASPALPALSEFFPPAPSSPDRRERGMVVIETFVYMRRVVRR